MDKSLEGSDALYPPPHFNSSFLFAFADVQDMELYIGKFDVSNHP